MPTTYSGAGADAASQYDAAFRQIIDNDPDIQAVIRRVWGNTSRNARPSDTPDSLEKANHQASVEIGNILKRKGIELPSRTFINPRSGTIEGHRGWSGLSNLQKAAIIGAAAAATGGVGLALGGGAGAGAGAAGAGAGAAGGGAGAGAGGLAALGITPGVGAGYAASSLGALTPTLSAGTLAGLGGTAAGLGGTTAAAGGGILSRLFGGNSASDWADRLGSTITGMGENAAGNRGQAEGAQILRDQIARGSVSDYNQAQTDSQRLDLQRRQFAQDSQKNAFTNAMRGGLVSNWQPMNRPANIPNISFVGAGVGQGGRDAAKELERQAMLSLLNGEQFDPLPEIERFTPAAAQQPGTLERVSDWLGPLATLFGTRNQNPQTPTPNATSPRR